MDAVDLVQSEAVAEAELEWIDRAALDLDSVESARDVRVVPGQVVAL